MELRRLGRLGHQSSVLIYGAAALADVPQHVADESVQQALAAGINHFDVAADYGDAEVRLGALMDDLRPRVFLATKTGDRDREAAWASINRSLERLRTDSVDLLQLHAVTDLDQLDLCTRPGGALEAALRARDEGLVGAVGITGHSHAAPSTHAEALRRHPFDTVLTPLNPTLWQRPDYRRDYEALVGLAREQDAGLMVIKAISRRNWPEDAEHTRTTWYEPLEDAERIRAAVSWVLSHQEITGIATAGDVGLLGRIVAAEADRIPADDAVALLSDTPDYSSPFIAAPI